MRYVELCLFFAKHVVYVHFKRSRYSGGIRLPPNLTKIYRHWGLSDRIEKEGSVSQRVFMSKRAYAVLLAMSFSFLSRLPMSVGDGDPLGAHRWDVEMLEEAGGEFTFIHVRPC